MHTSSNSASSTAGSCNGLLLGEPNAQVHTCQNVIEATLEVRVRDMLIVAVLL
jgi:hypothetical protein